jgi:large subunit ribosomal protein L28
MSQKCDVCDKTPQFGHNVSHANNKTNRRWNLNLKKMRVNLRGSIKSVRVCTRCIKAGKVVKVV